MFAFLFSPIGKFLTIGLVVAIVVGGAILYIKMTNDTIQNLTTQVTALAIQSQSLQAVNDAMQKDIADVKKIQDATNNQLNAIRVGSAKAAQTLRNRTLNTSNTKALQDQVNKETSDAFKVLQDLSQ